MTTPIRRITPMMVVDDFKPALSVYAALGFETVDRAGPDCVGVRAKDGTCLILAVTDYVQREFGEALARRLRGTTIPYVWVHSIAEAEALLPPESATLGRCCDGGVREILVETEAGLMILAETPGR